MFDIFKQNHPKGLYLLFFVEMWERFAYYGMRSMLVLYMLQVLMFSSQKASFIYGLYTGFVYLTPLLGGYLADRFLGQRKCITIGSILMICGLFGLCINTTPVFFISLFLMICANGMFKSNISTIVGMLYGKKVLKRDSGFTIFYMGINLGALLSPLVCGTLAVIYGFRAGFFSAGIGMMLGFLIYKLFENKLLKEYGKYPVKIINNSCEEKTLLSKEEKKKIFSLFILIACSIIFWIGYEQAGSSLTLFAEYSVDRSFLGYKIPTEYFQSLNPFFIIFLAPIMSTIWLFLTKKGVKVSSVTKFMFAFILLGLSYLVLAFVVREKGQFISPIWLVIYYFIATIAELCLSPIGLSLVSKLAPKQFASLFMGTWFLASFAGNLLAGLFAARYELMSTMMFFLILAVLLIGLGIFIFIISPKLSKLD